jgi:hypothetical protein
MSQQQQQKTANIIRIPAIVNAPAAPRRRGRPPKNPNAALLATAVKSSTPVKPKDGQTAQEALVPPPPQIVSSKALLTLTILRFISAIFLLFSYMCSLVQG